MGRVISVRKASRASTGTSGPKLVRRVSIVGKPVGRSLNLVRMVSRVMGSFAVVGFGAAVDCEAILDCGADILAIGEVWGW